MSPALSSLAPVFILILVGYGLNKTFFVNPPFWQTLERLVYFVLFPALIVQSLAESAITDPRLAGLALSLFLSTLIVGGLILISKRYLNVDGPALTSIFMGSTRFNTYIGIAVAGFLYGDIGLLIASVAIAVLVPQVNILSILVLTKYASQSKKNLSWRSKLLLIISNPLILASFAGIVLSITSLSLPKVISTLLSDLGAASLPLGLMAVGAGLRLNVVYREKNLVIFTAIFKLLVMPVTTILLCYCFGVNGVHAKVAVLFACLPSASTAYILSRQLGGNAPLMSAIITVTTILAVATMPFFLIL